MTQTSTKTAGIDTSKSKLDVAVHGQNGHWQVPNSMAGWRKLTDHLAAAGKAHNAALIACARKLLIYANTVVQRGTPWTERPAHV